MLVLFLVAYSEDSSARQAELVVSLQRDFQGQGLLVMVFLGCIWEAVWRHIR